MPWKQPRNRESRPVLKGRYWTLRRQKATKPTASFLQTLVHKSVLQSLCDIASGSIVSLCWIAVVGIPVTSVMVGCASSYVLRPLADRDYGYRGGAEMSFRLPQGWKEHSGNLGYAASFESVGCRSSDCPLLKVNVST